MPQSPASAAGEEGPEAGAGKETASALCPLRETAALLSGNLLQA